MENKKLVMIPGPTPVTRTIQNEMGREIMAFGDLRFVKDYKYLIEDLKTLFETSGEVFVIPGTGTLAMEMAIANTTKKGDNILIVSNGFFGDRFIEICTKKCLKIDIIQSEWGTVATKSEIESKLKEKKYAAVTVSHVDTSTGACAPIEEIGKMLKNYEDTVFIVDGVCATAAEPEYIDEMGIDILLTGSQKAFGVSPGLAILFAGKKALERRMVLGNIPEYYIDFEKWLPVMKDPTKYFATPAINLVWALKESVNIIKEEGIKCRYERHAKNAKAMQAALESLGFKILANRDCRAVTLSNVIYPEGIDDIKFRGILAEEGVVVAGGLAAYTGKMFRLGHMGNIDTHDMVCTISAIERTLFKVGYNVKLGKGVGVLTRELLK